MSDVILHILSIIGIILLILLILLGTALLLTLLLLFWPVAYRVTGEKGQEGLRVTARADWLFGIFRVRYAYPEPGTLTMKLLWKNLIKKKPGGKQDGGAPEGENAGKDAHGGAPADAAEDGGADKDGKGGAPADAAEDGGTDTAGTAAGGGTEEEAAAPFPRFLEKILKIKYTILKIYDKIKEVWANISYYTGLLQEEDTALLWGHVKRRLGKILKNIRPRHIEADVIFGTGAPDTTGMAYGAYSMLSPMLGRGVCVTPDFGRAVLEGNIDVRGHITLYTLTWNALRLLLDRKLQLFIKKMKGGRKANGG